MIRQCGNRIVWRLLAPSVLVAILAGCASPARVEGMVAKEPLVETEISPALRESIRVTSVIGGEKTNPLWTSEISSEGFRLALEDSLRAAGLLSKLRSGGAYELEVTLKEVNQPMFGFDITVTTRARYTLVDSVSRQSVFGQEISASHTATTKDSWYGVDRLRLANEGAARKNIESFISQIRGLDMKEER